MAAPYAYGVHNASSADEFVAAFATVQAENLSMRDRILALQAVIDGMPDRSDREMKSLTDKKGFERLGTFDGGEKSSPTGNSNSISS